MRKLGLLALVFLTLSCGKRETAAPQTASTGTHGYDASRGSTAATATQSSEPGIEIGSMMPAYSATYLDGAAFDVTSLRDKVVLLNVWATWCGPCRTEIPELEIMHQKYAARGFEVVGVSVDEGGPQVVKEFIDQQKVTYPIALDPEGKLASLFQTSVLPTSVLLDRKGRIVWKKYEQILPNDRELIQAIEKSL
jgi:thiol-disulfide isomerase/thioredoxin